MNADLSSLDTLQFKNSLNSHCTSETLIGLIQVKLKTIPDVETQKYNPELILWVCRLIEQSVYDNRLSVDKSAMFMTIYSSTFEMTAVDEVVCRKLVDFLLANNMVKFETKNLAFLKRLLGSLGRLILLKFTEQSTRS